MSIREKAREWLDKGKDRDSSWAYDESYEFFNGLSRGELLAIIEALARVPDQVGKS
jgi:hypothetical protein